MGPDLMVILAAPLVNKIFTTIVDSRALSFKALRDLIRTQGQPTGLAAQLTEPTNGQASVQLSEAINDQIRKAVEILKDANLVKESAAPVEDFNMYYVTGEGLDVGWRLSKLRAMSEL